MTEDIRALAQHPTAKPVAYVPLSKSERDKGEPIWREVFDAKWRDKDVWRGFDLKPLYFHPAPRTPAEGERQRCMEILEDVPGETLVDRVNRLKDWHQELSNSYHDAIAEARTERDQSIALVENASDIIDGLLALDLGSAERAAKFLAEQEGGHPFVSTASPDSEAGHDA